MKKLYIIDASGYLYRSYFAISQMTNPQGESTNALFGFIRSLVKLMKDFPLDHIVAVFDGPNNGAKRIALSPTYKAHRQKMPQDLVYQIEWAKNYCEMQGIAHLCVPGVEADDTMGAIAIWAEKQGITSYICSSDKDLCQLVTDQILILNTFKDNLILDPKGVEAQFGVRPSQIVDYLAMLGDASDNVQGLTGFGPKTAAGLLQQYDSLDYILEHPEKVTSGKKLETILNEGDQVRVSRQLVTLDLSVEVPTQASFYALKPLDYDKLKEFYSRMNFVSLIRELGAQPKQPAENITQCNYCLIDDEEALKALVKELSKHKELCLDVETTDLSPQQSELVGIGLGADTSHAWYIPMNGQLGQEKALHLLKPLLENHKIGFYGHNFKYDLHVLTRVGIEIKNICFDTLLASYLLNSNSRQHSLDYLSLQLFDKVKTPIDKLIGKGKKQISMRDVPLEQISSYCCEDVEMTIRLKERLEPELETRGMGKLYREIELPLMPVLAKMERHGIYVDAKRLSHLSKEMAVDISRLVKEIYDLAGEEFNLNSPKQLSQILFDKLQIKPPRKTATGFSTDADVLETLALHYPIAQKIADYRGMEKLRSTYLDSLPTQINPNTHRIHCTFNQSGTATGRLSCQDPNLQNIPVRTEAGRKIREAFLPEKPGWSYLAADYSQIELRILAHLSGDPALIDAFNQGKDIHTFTASLMFGIPVGGVSQEQRYQAKAVNFGIIYGQSAYGLSQELDIDTRTADTFIRKYFERYPLVRNFLDARIAEAKKTGKAVTACGRERLIPEINSKNGILRSAAERLAVNTPIQGTQSDIIKMAMLRIDHELKERKLQSFMVLQIHDELIFEVPDEEIDEVALLVRETMEGVISFLVPLVVDIHIGKNWKEC